jgi:hypothetical protein
MTSRKPKRRRAPGAGRPPKPPDEVRSKVVRVLLTPPELVRVERAADADGVTPAIFGHRVIMAEVDDTEAVDDDTDDTD